MNAMFAPVRREVRKSMGAAVLVGIGMMAAIDEIVFHQLLSWHHFYDNATPTVALFSDGLLHSAELMMLVAGFFMIANLRGRQVFASRGGVGWFLHRHGRLSALRWHRRSQDTQTASDSLRNRLFAAV